MLSPGKVPKEKWEAGDQTTTWKPAYNQIDDDHHDDGVNGYGRMDEKSGVRCSTDLHSDAEAYEMMPKRKNPTCP